MKSSVAFKRCAALAALAVSCLLAPSAQSAVVRNVTGGILTGATGVTVGSSTYSVEFVDGTCASVFGSCAQSSFAFTSGADAVLASQALLDQVFLDSSLGLFDSLPEMTNGCVFRRECLTLTPFDVFSNTLNSGVAFNFGTIFTATDFSSVSFDNPGSDTSLESAVVFAVFRLEQPPAPNAIPEPGTMALLGVAGAALTWTQRRRRAVTPV